MHYWQTLFTKIYTNTLIQVKPKRQFCSLTDETASGRFIPIGSFRDPCFDLFRRIVDDLLRRQFVGLTALGLGRQHWWRSLRIVANSAFICEFFKLGNMPRSTSCKFSFLINDRFSDHQRYDDNNIYFFVLVKQLMPQSKPLSHFDALIWREIGQFIKQICLKPSDASNNYSK